MTTEIAVLFLALLLAVTHIFLPAILRLGEEGALTMAGARDNLGATKSTVISRLQRANANFMETFPIAIALLLMTKVLGAGNAITGLGALIYLAGRVFYLPLYALGIPFLRSIAFGAAMAGLIMIATGLLRVIL